MDKVVVKVNGVEEEREVDYEVYRGKNSDGSKRYVKYPRLEHGHGAYEHIYENEDEVEVYTSMVR